MVAILTGVRVISWNLFHGRDHPPEDGLHGWHSRLFGSTVSGTHYVQVNRDLLAEFATVLARADWDVALLQEVSPRWLGPLCRATGAAGASALTSRNLGAWMRGHLAGWNPDLLASSAGGSNQILLRAGWQIAEVRRMTLTRRPQRRRMLWVRIERSTGSSMAAACVHLSESAEAARADLDLAVAAALEWSGELPLLFGGDLNLRPRTSPDAFDHLADLGLTGATAQGAVDHLLWNGPSEPPTVDLKPAWRELPNGEGLLLRLSDHDAVVRDLDLGGPIRRAEPRSPRG